MSVPAQRPITPGTLLAVRKSKDGIVVFIFVCANRCGLHRMRGSILASEVIMLITIATFSFFRARPIVFLFDFPH